MKFYHFDRGNLLKENSTVSLMKFDDLEPAYLNEFLLREFPAGVSRHGDQYYASRVSDHTLSSTTLESIFEYERRIRFPHKISRFQSFFAVESLSEIATWLAEFPPYSPYTVWEVEVYHNNFAKYDASWLAYGGKGVSLLLGAYHARMYWDGRFDDKPIPEILIKPPVHIVKKITL